MMPMQIVKISKAPGHLVTFVSLPSLTFLLLVIFLYLTTLSSAFHRVTFSVVDKVFSTMVLSSFLFWGIHCIGYVDKLIKSLLIYSFQFNSDLKKNGNTPPKVAIFIPVFNEEPKIVEPTIAMCTQINYNNFEIFLLDDSTDEKIHKNLMKLSKRFDINYIHRRNRRGYKAGAINDAINNLNEDVKYLLIVDADHRLKPDILNEVVPILENNPSIAFVQTPQYFTEKTGDRLAIAYSFQQHIFNKHVCRGLSVNNSAFITGTNVIIRLSYLRKIGGIDESCITEDIATSFTFHSHGYNSIYLDKVYAEGIAPPSLSAYFTQQMRWAYGTTQNFKKVIKAFLSNPRSLKFAQWWEYMLNGSWYLLSWAFLIWLLYPIAVLLLGIKPLVLSTNILFFLLFVSMIGSQFVTSMRERDYRIKDLLISQALYNGLFPVFIRASIYALLGRKMEFRVTPKTLRHRYEVKTIPFTQIFPHLLVLGFLIVSIIVGIWKMTTESIAYNIQIAIYWAIYYAIMLLIFIFLFYLEDVRKVKINENQGK